MSSSHSRSNLSGTLLVLLSMFGFSAKSIFAKLAYQQHCDALTLVFWRMLLSLPFFLIAIGFSLRHDKNSAMNRQDWLHVVLLGVAGYYLSSILDFEGLMFISASLERLTLFLYPTLVVLLDWYFNKRPLQRTTIIALILSYAGISLVVLHDLAPSHALGVGLALVAGSSLSYACYLLGSQPLIERLGSTRFTGYTLTVASLAVMIQGFGQIGSQVLHINQHVFLLGLATALFSTVMPVFLLTAGIARIGSQRSALIGSAGPVATMFLGLWILKEPITSWQILGAVLVIAGVLLVGQSAKDVGKS